MRCQTVAPTAISGRLSAGRYVVGGPNSDDPRGLACEARLGGAAGIRSGHLRLGIPCSAGHSS
jgi:hypothetical protein